jgi:hypothetical protein
MEYQYGIFSIFFHRWRCFLTIKEGNFFKMKRHRAWLLICKLFPAYMYLIGGLCYFRRHLFIFHNVDFSIIICTNINCPYNMIWKQFTNFKHVLNFIYEIYLYRYVEMNFDFLHISLRKILLMWKELGLKEHLQFTK